MSSRDVLESAEVPNEKVTRARGRFRGARIALVDEDEENLRLLTLILRKAGNEVVITAKTREEIGVLAEAGQLSQADTIVTNHTSSTDVSGMEAVSDLERRINSGVRVVVITGHGVQLKPERDDFQILSRPFSMSYLLDAVDLADTRGIR